MEYVVAKCPNCGYHWSPRVKVTVEEVRQDKNLAINKLKTCPRCKRRFDTPWSKKPTLWIENHENYRDLSNALEKYNKV